MTTETKLPFDRDFVQGLSQENREPNWLKELRLQALNNVEVLPMPRPDKTKIDKWNFTPLKGHQVKSGTFAALSEMPEEVKELSGENQNIYVQRNQTPAYLHLSEELKSQGVIFTDLFTAAREHSDLLKKYFMTQVTNADEHRLTAMHAALVNGGVFLYVPKNVVIEEPIQAIFLHDDAEASLINHVIVAADDNSSVTYVENYISTVAESTGVNNIIAEVISGTNAKIQFGAVDNLAKGMTTYVNRRGITGRDSHIEWALGMMNEGNTISDNTTNLIGDGSSGDTKTVTVGRGDQIQNFTTKVIHFGKHTNGNILNHAVVKESATTVFNGIGKIEHGASKSDAEQTSRILMLSEKARGDANPILLIDEDDVMAGHAASVGRVDPVQLYYMMSRGIPQTEAERLVIHGFLAPVVSQLPIEGVKTQLTEVIERKVR